MGVLVYARALLVGHFQRSVALQRLRGMHIKSALSRARLF